MAQRKASLSLKTAAKNRSAQALHSRNETNQATTNEKRILKGADLNRSNTQGFGSAFTRRGSYLETLETSPDQNESLNFHCSFENDSSPAHEIDIPCTQPLPQDKILQGVVAYIEVRSNTENRFEGISKQVEMLGAMVTKKFTPEVTHVIFKDGKKATRDKALKRGIHLVSVLWVESCRQSGKLVSEDLFPVVETSEPGTPLMVGRLRRTKSMQPKAFEEDVQNSADRGERRRKRKLQAVNVTPSAVILCAETQDPYSPPTPIPVPAPHMVPDTPCHGFEMSAGPEDKLKGPIKFFDSESDQSEDSSDETPSSIRKMKKRLINKNNLNRPPSLTLIEPVTTPVADPKQDAKDVQLTGSERAKKRKRQEEHIKGGNAAQKKRLNIEGQETNSNAEGRLEVKTGSEEMNSVATRNDNNASVTCDNGIKNTNGGIGRKMKPTKTPREKKSTQAKTKGDVSQEINLNQKCEEFVSESAVFPTNENRSTVKKKFSKTARVLGNIDTVDFRDLKINGTESNGGALKREHCLKNETGCRDEKTLIPQKVIKQEKLVCRENLVSLEKPVYRVNGGGKDEMNEEDDVKGKNENESKEEKASKREISSEIISGDDNDTCTEEEEQQAEENQVIKKQKTKPVKILKPKRSIVMTSMHFNEQDIVLSVVRKLGGFFIEDRVSPATSHVIAGSPRRTLNVLMAIAQGCWLVSPTWIMKALEVGHWVDEEPYELSEAFPAAQLCRLERVSVGAGYRQELFVDCPPIFVSENCSPPSDSLIALISLCGGKVSLSVRKAGICIGSMTRRTQAVNITEQWLLDCITQHVVLPFTNYALNTPAKRRRETSPSY
ncbi:microcephalin-like [Montipora capricornis]|uniref:microcephalin-like n=1 Tax=Montipora capricornis TaxID=246305 RepID=UPI0035F219A3